MEEPVFFKKTFNEFLNHLNEHSITTTTKFVVLKTQRNFRVEKVSPSCNQKLFWKDGIPYFHFGSRSYQCHHGKDKNVYTKKKYAEERDKKAAMDHSFKRRYNLMQTTKKLDCPASFNVSRVIWMPEFKIPGSQSEHYEKTKASRVIKDKVGNGESVGEEGYMYNLPNIEEHSNHLIGDNAAVTEPLDNQVRDYICQLVRRGERNAAVISKLLETFVESQLHETNKLRRRFFPNLATVRRIISSEKLKLKKSPIDQENTELLIKSWGGKNGQVFFRPCTKISESENFDEPENEQRTSILERNLLFVYQSENMKRLYEIYGKNAIFLDATYRTCKYALPLFFLVVNTNVNYQVVGVIITQFETKDSVSEGLSIIKQWNPSVNPKYAMVDFAAEEISSLEATFPGIKVFICSFHREQAWMRWISRGANANVPKKEALTLLRKIAHASSEEELIGAIDKMKTEDFYSKTSLKSYFEGTWLREIKRWATAYKPLDFHINTNNGVERMNKELKYGFLEGFKGCSLSEMIKVIVENFLPERYRIYVEKNLKMSSGHRKYDDKIPNFLQEKPKWFIKLIMGKFESFSDSDVDKVEQTGDSSFTVESFSEVGKKYFVFFEEETQFCKCSCRDFSKERLICKHILVVGLKFPAWHLQEISHWLFSDPVFNQDNQLKVSQKFYYTAEASNTNQHDKSEEFSENEGETTTPEYRELPLRGSNRRHLMNKCNSALRSLQSVQWNLNDDDLNTHCINLENLLQSACSKVSADKSTGLPVETKTDSSLTSQNKKRTKDYGKLSLRIKRGCSGRVGMSADMMKEATKLNIENQTPVAVPVKKSKISFQ